MRLFLYGTLAEAQALARCGGRPRRAAGMPACLQGYRRVLLRGTRYPTVRRTRGAFVNGFLALVSAEELRRLTAYESDRYRRVNVRVHTERGFIAASCFFGAAPTKVAWHLKPHQVTLRSRHF